MRVCTLFFFEVVEPFLPVSGLISITVSGFGFAAAALGLAGLTTPFPAAAASGFTVFCSQLGSDSGGSQQGSSRLNILTLAATAAEGSTTVWVLRSWAPKLRVTGREI